MRGLALSKEAIIDYQHLKELKNNDDVIFLLIDKFNNIVLNVYGTVEEVEKSIANIKDHYRFGQVCFDMAKLSEIKSELPYLM